MNYSTHYNLNLAEGTDLVNPLTVDVPNYQTIDNTMYANEQSGIGLATELKSGTIHAITRTAPARNVFKFIATSIFNLGDTFTVDGNVVTALYPDQSSLKERCFIVGSEILCLLNGAQLTVLATYYPEAQNVAFDDTNVSFTASNTQTAIEAVTNSENIKYKNTPVKTLLDEFIKIQTDTFSDLTFGTGNWEHYCTITAPNGYRCIGIAGYSISRIAGLNVTIMMPDTNISSSINVRVAGNNTGASDTGTIQIKTIWIKTNIY